MNAGEIAHHFNLTKPSILHHLDVLKRANLVTHRKEGQFINYWTNTTIIDDLAVWVLGLKQFKNK